MARFISTLGGQGLQGSVVLVLADGPHKPSLQALGAIGIRPRLVTEGELETAIAEGAVDLVVIDRGADGVGPLRAVKDRDREVAVILVTSDAAVRVDAMRAGADHCASGTTDRDELCARARWLIETAAVRRAGSARLATLRLWHDWVRYLVHDLRNPITIASLPIAAAAARGDERMQSAERALRSANAMLQDILDTDRFRHGVIALRKERVDVAELAEAVAHELHLGDEAEAKANPRVEISRMSATSAVDADPALLRRLLVNLFENARRFARQKPVTVEITGTAHGLSVRVANDGPGIEPALRPRLFDPWHTMELDGEAYATGLGLAFCRMVCEAHGGRIWLESGEPGDVAFAFGLPNGAGPNGAGPTGAT